ncbi:MAG: 50S ribosomal protein L25 [Candidatus Berkelbacteria bacterium]|nr:50S ribosomal protein L25 [Candidatus Berkelbacteria bacterium]
MVEEYELGAELRADEKAKSVRNDKKIPAVVYGNEFKNTSIAVDAKVFNKVFQEAGESALINLKIDSDPAVKVLVHDTQIHPTSGDIIHIDFYKVNMKEKIKTAIPIVEIGESPAVIDLEGALINNRDEVEVECLPGDLIPEIEVDISVLKTFDDVIKVSDLKIPAGIEILDDADEVIFLIQPPRSDEELAELEEEVTEDVEAVEGVADKPAEGEEAAEGEAASEEKAEEVPTTEK